jgi:glycosyltransferase involved in cell wall biosynthesis
LFEKRVIAVGRYSFEKGIDLLIKAWKIVEDLIPDWRLDIFGDGDQSVYKELTEQLNIEHKRCVLHGRTTNVQKEYVNSSIFVCSSRFEGFGLAIVEAMACGLPVVSFDCPWGPRSIIKDNEDGLLVEDGNPQQLALALKSLMDDGTIRKRMASAALVNVRRFQLQEIAEKWKTLVFREI